MTTITYLEESAKELRTIAAFGLNFANNDFDELALVQGIEIGGKLWTAFGPDADAGSTGIQGSYGWKHHHRIKGKQEMRAIIANYASRGVFPDASKGDKNLYRYFGGQRAGRIFGAPKWRMFGNVGVGGIDAEHACYGPLWALIDVTDDPGGEEWNVPARLLAKEHVSALSGQLRKPELGAPDLAVPWTFSDRAAARILETIVEAHERKCITDQDATTALHWIEHAFLPFYESGVGIHEFVKGKKGIAETYRVGIPNGLGLLIPVLWDATRSKAKGGIPAGPIKDRLRAVLKRLCGWMVELHEFDNEALSSYAFHLDRLAFAVVEPPSKMAHWIDHVEPPDPNGTDWRPWMYRAVAIADEVTGQDFSGWLDAVEADVANDPAQKVWMVGPDGEYV